MTPKNIQKTGQIQLIIPDPKANKRPHPLRGRDGGDHSEDFLGYAVAAFQGNPALERILAAASDAVMAVYRFVKNAIVHNLDNDAVAVTLDSSYEILQQFAQLVGDRVTFTFVDDTVFVCGELLKANRGVYESAIELGRIMRRCGVVELSLEPSFHKSDLLIFAEPFKLAYGSRALRGALISAEIPNIKVREFDAQLEAKDSAFDRPVREQILMLYANALVAHRGYLDRVAQGASPSPQKLKRIAQRMVTLSESGDPALVGMTTLANAHRDDAGRGLQTAILSVALARGITRDRLALSRIAMAALMADSGRTREVGSVGRDRLLRLTRTQDKAVPLSTGAVCIAGGGVNESAAARAVVAFEATWLERESILGNLYGERLTPTLQARIVRVARALLDRLAPRDTARAKSPVDALNSVLAEPFMDSLMRRLLIGAVGFIPGGTVVELDSGEWGVVIGPSTNPNAPDRPRVRLVTDRAGRAVEPPREIDLGRPTPGERALTIARIVEPGQARFNPAAVFAA